MEKIVIDNDNGKIIVPFNNKANRVLFFGNINGLFGKFNTDNLLLHEDVLANNFMFLLNSLKLKGRKMEQRPCTFLIPERDYSEYIEPLYRNIIKYFGFSKKDIDTHTAFFTYKKYKVKDGDGKEEKITEEDNAKEKLKYFKENDMKFDYIIQNPPYNVKLHLDFLEEGLDLLSENGKMVIIEPATWLINMNPNSEYVKGSKKNHTPKIKERIEGHVESVKIENFNKDFGTRLFMPFAITTIDFSKTFEEIEFICCGEKKFVKSIYDCNLVGDHATLWSIIEKCQKFGDMMKSHITKENMGEGMWYTKYQQILGSDCVGCGGVTERGGMKYDSNTLWASSSNGEYERGYFSPAYHHLQNSISDKPVCSCDAGKHLTDKIAGNIYGTRRELENWKHFIFNNKLPLFLNIVLTIDQNNCSKEFLPWLVDKQYTDDEINEMFGFTDEEIKLINRTIEKYERNSPWFKRFMCGPDSVSDKEVYNFISKLNEKYA